MTTISDHGERRCTVNCPHPDHHPKEGAWTTD